MLWVIESQLGESWHPMEKGTMVTCALILAPNHKVQKVVAMQKMTRKEGLTLPQQLSEGGKFSLYSTDTEERVSSASYVTSRAFGWRFP